MTQYYIQKSLCRRKDLCHIRQIPVSDIELVVVKGLRIVVRTIFGP